MRKIFCVAITYIICAVVGLSKIWLWFAPVLLVMLLFRIPDSIWWEIPIGVLVCGVIEAAFGEDLTVVIRLLISASSVLIAYSSPRRLPMFFMIVIAAIYYENIYAVSAVLATTWYGVRVFFLQKTPLPDYSTTKEVNLQEYN